MVLGHYGVALGSKRLARDASLGTLVFAAEFLDELWPILLLLDVERVQIAPGAMAASPLIFTSYPISHSLAAATLWAVLIGGVHYWVRRRGGVACVVGAAVLSHWWLDLPMHAADLQLWPTSPVRVGFGLWNSIPTTVILELVCFGVGLMIYTRSTRPLDRIGRFGLWSMVAALLMIFASGFISPPPRDAHTLAIMALSLWLFIPWAAWVDRHRGWTSA